MIQTEEAAAMLADVASVVARVKQSRIYRNAAFIIIFWGVVNLARNLFIAIGPAWFGQRWFVVDLVGVAATIAFLRRDPAPSGRFQRQILAAFALFYAFGWIWSDLLGHFGPRAQMAFWPTLFLFGYAVAGLWFGVAFCAIGLGLTAVIVASFLWSGDAFFILQAGVTSVGFMLCGLWMRPA